MGIALWLLTAVVFGTVIGVLLGRMILRMFNARREQRLEAQRQAERHRALLDSLEIICQTVLQKQMDLSEAVIRLDVLLHSIPEETGPKVDVAAIHQLAEECQKFDRGEARKALAPRERNQQDLQRMDLEIRYEATSTQAIARLCEVIPRWRQQLLDSK